MLGFAWVFESIIACQIVLPAPRILILSCVTIVYVSSFSYAAALGLVDLMGLQQNNDGMKTLNASKGIPHFQHFVRVERSSELGM
jgi:hypothetical protein